MPAVEQVATILYEEDPSDLQLAEDATPEVSVDQLEQELSVSQCMSFEPVEDASGAWAAKYTARQPSQM